MLNWDALFAPLFICLARISDVSIGTIRIIMIGRGNRLLASLLGFFEVIIWLLAIGQVFKNLDNVASYLAYGLGFALGNFIGISIENKLALGYQIVQIVTEDNLKTLSMLLREEGFKVTHLYASNERERLDFLYLITPRKKVRQAMQIAREFDPNALISVSDVRSAYPQLSHSRGRRWRAILKKK
ncbi:DUF2179 domain-containing protein [Calditrichota bacterium LG25]